MKKTVFASLLLTCSFLSNSYGQEANSFSIPTEKWSLQVDLSDFKITNQVTAPDNSAIQVTAIDEKNAINLSIFIEKASADGDKNTCRDFYWGKAEKSPLTKENLKKYETETSSIVEHDTKKFQGQTVDFHSLNAYLANNGYWIDVHVSKIGYAKKDSAIFNKIVKSLSIKN